MSEQIAVGNEVTPKYALNVGAHCNTPRPLTPQNRAETELRGVRKKKWLTLSFGT